MAITFKVSPKPLPFLRCLKVFISNFSLALGDILISISVLHSFAPSPEHGVSDKPLIDPHSVLPSHAVAHKTCFPTSLVISIPHIGRIFQSAIFITNDKFDSYKNPPVRFLSQIIEKII